MSRTLAVPYNIRSHAAALAEGLSYDDRVHLRVKENRLTGDFFFIKFIGNHEGILVHTRCDRIIQRVVLWDEILELWLLEEKPNIYHSDVPEVVDVLKKLKAGIQKRVQANDSAGVLYLLDQVSEARKAEPLFKEAREIIASVRI